MTDIGTSFSSEEEEVQRQRQQIAEERMRADGIPTEEHVAEDYFGFEETHQCFLPDRISFIEHKTLNEGARKEYRNKSNQDVRLQKGTGDAFLRLRQGDDLHTLLKLAISGWNLRRKDGSGQMVPVAFSKRSLDEWLEKAPPRVVDLVYKDIVRVNPWLLADMTVEQIDEEIKSLQEMREQKLREEEGKDA